MPGYAAAVGSNTPSALTSNNRVVGRIAADATSTADGIDTTTSTLFTSSADSARSAASADGKAFYVAGTSGLFYMPIGATRAAQVTTLASPFSLRAVVIFQQSLYVSSSACAPVCLVGRAGSLPTSGKQTLTTLGFDTASNSPWAFVLFDTDSVAGPDVLYVCDDGGYPPASLGLHK